MSVNDQNLNGTDDRLRRWVRETLSRSDDQGLTGHVYSDSAKTAEWMVSITCGQGGGILTSSNNSKYQQYCRSMTNPDYSITRRTNANVVDTNKYDSSRVRISNLIFAIPHDTWTAQLENITVQGMLVDSIEFIRLTNQGMVDEVAEDIKFYESVIQQIQQFGDIVVLEARVERLARSTIRRNQMNQEMGQTSFEYSVRNSIAMVG